MVEHTPHLALLPACTEFAEYALRRGYGLCRGLAQTVATAFGCAGRGFESSRAGRQETSLKRHDRRIPWGFFICNPEMGRRSAIEVPASHLVYTGGGPSSYPVRTARCRAGDRIRVSFLANCCL
jgi:hypothetical protein